MNIALINGSPKTQGSASGGLLDSLTRRFDGRAEFIRISLRHACVPPETVAELLSCESWVLAFPLYVDCLPSHLLSCLMQLEQAADWGGKRLYAVINCGFFEGSQTGPAAAVVENFCLRAGLSFDGGVGIGSGAALNQLPEIPGGHGPRGPIDTALDSLCENVLNGRGERFEYIQPALPRMLYKLAGQMGWRQQIKQNGGKPSDLGRRIT